jgi:ubiquinone/menaquinone biosynthesis C-methylase UbiE
MPQLPPPSQHDSAYFDFLEGLKVYNYTHNIKGLLNRYEETASEFKEERGYAPSTMEEAGCLLEPELLYQFACATQHCAQHMMWSASADSIAEHRERLLALMQGPNSNSCVRLEFNPNLKLPTWYTEHDIHLTPGGYWKQDLVGAVYQRALGVYSTSWRRGRDPGSLMAFVRCGQKTNCRRVLDLGSSTGAVTMTLRRAYPEAEEVVGLDISAAILKWSSLTAEERGLKIRFVQGDAANTGFPDNHFDLITAHLLLHEVPPEVGDQILHEAFRLLAPGGTLLILEAPRYGVLPPELGFLEDFDTRGNGEAFWGPFLSRDLPSVLRGIGFVDVKEGPLEYEEQDYWGSAALMRTGEFQPHNRWVTQGDKPSRQ